MIANQNTYRSKQSNLPVFFIIAGLSVGITLLLSHFLSIKNEPVVRYMPPDPGYGQDVTVYHELNALSKKIDSIIQQPQIKNDHVVTQINSETPPMNITWMNSPVMQHWKYNESKALWEAIPSYKDSFRSSPTIIIGLREDGVVVWKKVTK